MRLVLAFIFSAIQFQSIANTVKLDSIGVESVGETSYILHEVKDNETLYSLSRIYNVPIYKIIESNPPTEFGLETGQIVKIPIIKKKVEQPINEQSIREQPLLKPVVTSTVISPKVAQDKYHTVLEKETLYSISRLYDVSVSEIKTWNKLESNDLTIGQRLIIKDLYLGTSLDQNPKITQRVPNTGNLAKTHIVKTSETLFSISRMYEVNVNDIKKWNDLTNNDISIGQELKVSQGATSIIKPDVVRVEDTVVTIQIKNVVKNIDTAKYNIKPEVRTNFEEIIEDGMAEQIDGTQNNRKYLALHRSAKVGTIMKVRNEMNDQEVFVRIIGKLPNTDLNKNLVIKLSKAAYERLGAIDPKFRVTVSYIP
jgi:LysM repeat protein